jgi:nucleoside 2-deoxyribosyltransferase
MSEEKKELLYLCGAISGNPIYREQFDMAEKSLVAAGYRVFNPARIVLSADPDSQEGWEEAMMKDIVELFKCDAIAVVNPIYHSRGALREIGLANDLRMRIKDVFLWLLESREDVPF